MATTAIAAMIAVGCMPGFPAPQLIRVSPDRGYNGEATSIEIVGSKLYPGVVANGAKDVRLDREFRAWLRTQPETELDAVRMLDYGRLGAEVPPGIEPGLYGVRIRTSTGDEATLADAFTVTDTRADHLSAETDQVVYAVQQIAVVRIGLLDPGDILVPTALPIQVHATGSAVSADGLEFIGGTLSEQTTTNTGIAGQLDASGQGYIAFTSREPGDVSIEIASDSTTGGIASASQLMTFAASEVARVAVDLPEESFKTVAGEPFDVALRLVDVDGNPVAGKPATVLLVESCSGGTLSEFTTFLDSTTVSVAPTVATSGSACPKNHIIAVGVVEGSSVEGSSDGFEVSAAPLDGLAIVAAPSLVVAGEIPVTITVTGVDAWQNIVTDVDEALVLSDSIGPLRPENGNGTHECGDFVFGTSVCAATLYRGGINIELIGTVASGATGSSNPITVIPGPAESVEVKVLVGTTEAGTSFSVGVQVTDGFENPISLATETFETTQFFDDAGTVECSLVSVDETSTLATFHCICTVATADNVLLVVIDDVGASGESDPFDVVPGPLASIDFVLTKLGMGAPLSQVEAGGHVDAAVSGYDAWGNQVTDEVEVLIVDLVDGIPATTLSLTDGTAAATLQPIVAVEGNTLAAIHDASLVGVSDPFDVVAREMEALDLNPPGPWIWLEEDAYFEVRPVDTFGNPVLDFTTTAVLQSASGLGADVSVTIAGPTLVPFTFDEIGLDDEMTVSDGTWTGTSEGYDVVADCSEGPTISVTVTGATRDTLCLDGDGTVEASIEIEPGDLKRYHFVIGDTPEQTDAPVLVHTFDGPGRDAVTLAAISDSGCAAETRIDVYRGEPGLPAGPIEVSVADGSLIAGTTGGDEQTEVSVIAWDCSGDFASGGSVLIRANLGALTSDGALGVTGSGLALALDAAGAGTATWSMAEVRHEGEATVWVGTADGASFGARTVDVSGDSTPPLLLELMPWGTSSGAFSDVELVFSEPMLTTLSESVVLDSVVLSDPAGVPVVWTTFAWSSDGHVLTLFMDTPGSLDDGAWTLLVGDELRDAAGNRLDGDFDSVSGGALTTEFGAVPDTAPDTTGCGVDTHRIRHDGDPGAGFEADEVAVTLETSAAATWWTLDVVDAAGVLVDHRRTEPTGTVTGTVSWDGRGLDGFALANGLYTLRFAATDAAWNPGEPCVVAVRADNHVAPSE